MDNHWDKYWESQVDDSAWSVPHEEVTSIIDEILETNCENVLDLGCGTGRHSIFFAKNNFSVTAVDYSKEGILRANVICQSMTNKINFVLSDYGDLPFSNNSFDFILSWNTIYHGTEENTLSSIYEIGRVLKDGRLFQGTLLSKHNSNFGIGVEVSRDTWINLGKDDKAHPHFYASKKQVCMLFAKAGFQIVSLRHIEQIEHSSGAFHWHFVVKKIEK